VLSKRAKALSVEDAGPTTSPVPLAVDAIVWLGHVPVTVTFVPATMLGVDVPVPPLATGSVPVTPVVNGKPVALVNVALVGVPKIGVTKVGDVANTADPVPVSSVKAPKRLAELNEPREVALPVEVIAPVKLAFVVTLPAVKPEAVPVIFVPTNALGVPRAGVTRVGLVAKTNDPVPVSSVTAEIRFALDGVPRKVATPVPRPETPVLIGKPVAFVKVPLVGVPRIGVTRVGEVAKTNEPEPVSSVIAEAKLALEGVAKRVATPVPKPLTPVEIGRPVAFVKTAALGVPRAGVTNVGEFDNTTFPVPVEEVTPVPPFATGKVPVMSAVERLTASHVALVPSVCRYLFALLVWLGNRLFNAPAAVEAPVPPSATARSVMPVIEPPVIAAAELSVFVAIAVAMLLYSVSISVPLTIFKGFPGDKLSLVAKFTVLV